MFPWAASSSSSAYGGGGHARNFGADGGAFTGQCCMGAARESPGLHLIEMAPSKRQALSLDASMQQHCFRSPSSSQPTKRKSVKEAIREAPPVASSSKMADRAQQEMSDQIKRCRISTSPGEIRMQKDFNDLQNLQLQHLTVEYADDPSNMRSQLLLEFKVESSVRCPNRFSITIRKFYPHDAPEVRCLDASFVCPFISPSGLLSHKALVEEWSALGSLHTIIDAVQTIRAVFLALASPLSPGRPCMGAVGALGDMEDTFPRDAAAMAYVHTALFAPYLHLLPAEMRSPQRAPSSSSRAARGIGTMNVALSSSRQGLGLGLGLGFPERKFSLGIEYNDDEAENAGYLPGPPALLDGIGIEAEGADRCPYTMEGDSEGEQGEEESRVQEDELMQYEGSQEGSQADCQEGTGSFQPAHRHDRALGPAGCLDQGGYVPGFAHHDSTSVGRLKSTYDGLGEGLRGTAMTHAHATGMQRVAQMMDTGGTGSMGGDEMEDQDENL